MGECKVTHQELVAQRVIGISLSTWEFLVGRTETGKVLGESDQRRRNQRCYVGLKKASELSGCSSISSCSE